MHGLQCDITKGHYHSIRNTTDFGMSQGNLNQQDTFFLGQKTYFFLSIEFKEKLKKLGILLSSK